MMNAHFITINFLSHFIFADLKQELKIRNISLPSKHNNEVIDKTNKSMTASKTNDTLDNSSVSKMNDINDSRNNNSLSLNASMDKTTFNNTSLMDTTIHNMSCGTTDSISPKSTHDSAATINSKPSQNSVLKCKFIKLLSCWKR